MHHNKGEVICFIKKKKGEVILLRYQTKQPQN